jgi:carbohydrate kinase (thermoresistant glucokinase family)
MFVVVMGVTGSGKTTIGQLLAGRLSLPFHDADDFHTPEKRAKMARNEPLDDDDRWPWLRLLAQLSVQWEAQGGAVLACSAVKQSYRDVLLEHVPHHRVVYLEVSRAAVERRLEVRRGHHQFVGDFDHLLDGQFGDLEPPHDAITISAELSPGEIVERAAAALLNAPP